MSFKLSNKSQVALLGVSPKLAAVVKRAIEVTKIDFAVIEGLRTEETQRKYVASGKSQTMASKHLTGEAVDLMAYLGSQPSWELNLYDEIADAMRQAAIELDTPLRWGAAWNVPDIRKWDGSMESAMNHYIDERRAQNKRPFIDAPHFELA